MEGLLSWLLFIGLLLLMRRFGCTLGLTRDGHGHDEKASAGETDQLDPVCGTSVDTNTGYGKMHEGHLYRFCSRVCLDKFEAEPKRYTAPR